MIAAAAPVFMLVSASGLGWVTALSSPATYDSLLARTDFGIAHAVMSWAQARTWAIGPLRLAYFGLPMAMMLGIAGASDERRWPLVRAALLGSVLVLPCYLIFPAVGPDHVGEPGAAPNCMPSLHLTWALLIWINSRGWMKWAAGRLCRAHGGGDAGNRRTLRGRPVRSRTLDVDAESAGAWNYLDEV